MWIERTTYTTAYTFPGILKWFEVKHISIVSHLKVELGIFLSPNKIRAFVKSPLWFSLAPPAGFIFQKRNKRHACRIELLCKTDVTTPVLKVTASEWLFYKTKWVLSPQGSCQHPETFLKFLLRVCYHLHSSLQEYFLSFYFSTHHILPYPRLFHLQFSHSVVSDSLRPHE